MAERLTLQHLLQHHLNDDTRPRDTQRLKVCRALQHCHSPALGGCRTRCDHCQAEVPQYHGCRNRHCPQCQHRATRRWCERQQQALLPLPYHHLVFTLPHTLNGWVQLHPEVIYRLLFRMVWQTLKAFAADPRRLGGQLGMTAVLHTWGQNLSRHVHLHCLIPGGVLTKEKQWRTSRNDYLFPVRALSRRFRGSMVAALRAAAKAGELQRVTRDIDRTLDALMQSDWVVYSKPCIHHQPQLVGYLARYTHRIALHDRRLLGWEDGQVLLRYTDYRDQKTKVMRLKPEELIRRFLLHVLPPGLMRVRHYGFLANRCRKRALQTIRQLLRQPAEPEARQGQDTERLRPCPKCKRGRLLPVATIPPLWPYPSMAPG